MLVYSNKKAKITFLLIEKVIILIKYLNFANIVYKKWAMVLLEQTDINKHTINLEIYKKL